MQEGPVVAFVPARSGSSRLPNKNLRRIGGVPLAIRKVRQLLAVPEVNEVWLDTDSEELIELATGLDVRVLRRPAELATNRTDGHELFEWEARNVPRAEVVVQALPTSPFLDELVMSQVLREFLESNFDSVLTISRAKNYLWEDGQPLYGSGRIPNSTDLEPLTIESMGFYAVRKSSLVFPSRRIGTRPLLFEINRLQALDIDDKEDFDLAVAVERGTRLIESQHFGLIKHYLSSPLLADVAKNFGMNAVASSELRLVTSGKLLGRARTMNLAPLSEESDRKLNEEWKEIYRGLNHYKSVNFGDVLCVGSGVQSRAYFGEINAHLALRVGASGAVVDSFTRDTDAVRAMNFPVFARGSWANDILYEGKAVDFGQPANVGGIWVEDGDVVFADSEGVVFFAADDWPRVLDAALDKRFQEERIKSAIVAGMDSEQVLLRFGDF